MHKHILLSLLGALAALSVGACDGTDGDAAQSGSRHGAYIIHNTLDERAVSSEVYRDGKLVAQVVLGDTQERITLLETGTEMVSSPPADYDPRAELARYNDSVAQVSDGLERAASAVRWRGGDCEWVDWTNSDGNYCIFSSCGGGCEAYDCAPDQWGEGESHYISAACGVS